MNSMALRSPQFALSSKDCYWASSINGRKYISSSSFSCLLPFDYSQRLKLKGNSAIIAAAKKENKNINNKRKKDDTHSFIPRPDEATGPFPEAVLLKEVYYFSFLFFFFFLIAFENICTITILAAIVFRENIIYDLVRFNIVYSDNFIWFWSSWYLSLSICTLQEFIFICTKCIYAFVLWASLGMGCSCLVAEARVGRVANHWGSGVGWVIIELGWHLCVYVLNAVKIEICVFSYWKVKCISIPFVVHDIY